MPTATEIQKEGNKSNQIKSNQNQINSGLVSNTNTC